MLQKVTRLDCVPTAEETVLTTEVPTKESRLYTLLHEWADTRDLGTSHWRAAPCKRKVWKYTVK